MNVDLGDDSDDKLDRAGGGLEVAAEGRRSDDGEGFRPMLLADEMALARAITDGLAISARMRIVRETYARPEGEFSSRLANVNSSLSGTPCSRHAARKRSMLAEIRVSSLGTLTR